MKSSIGEFVDILTDGTTGMSAQQFGAHCLLMIASWRQGGALEQNDTALAKLARLSPARWRVARGRILRNYDTSDGFYIRHRRLERSIAKVTSVSIKRAAASKLGNH